jgi:hypothetical protein
LAGLHSAGRQDSEQALVPAQVASVASLGAPSTTLATGVTTDRASPKRLRRALVELRQDVVQALNQIGADPETH